ncbi:MAG: GIY-YIG nuclease family protein [Agarilytica sp.]
MAWTVYIVKCADGSFYTGITTDVERRVGEHNHAKQGARYTRAKRPVALVYTEDAEDRSAATKQEIAIKKLTRTQKLALIESGGSGEH